MNYLDVLNFIQKTGKFGSKLGLDNITNLTNELGNPEKNLRFVHIAGTNGKGSTALFLSEIFKKAGYKTGLYTSPFIYEFNERIKINGKNIPDDKLTNVMERVILAISSMLKKGMEHPTEFEIITAAAFLYFFEEKCDVVCLEVGLGGRFDATNVIKNPVLSVITKIGIDHSEYLGNTIEEIAFEKCGIIKDGVPLVVAPGQNDGAACVIKNIAEEKNAPVYFANSSDSTLISSDLTGSKFIFRGKTYHLTQPGIYQVSNAITAICAAKILQSQGFNLSEDDVASALDTAIWPGRMEIISKKPVFLLDGSHNADGIDAFIKSAKQILNNKKVIIIFSMLKDKDYAYSLECLSEISDTIILTQIQNPRKESLDNLYKAAAGHFKNIYKEINAEDAVALSLSLAKPDDAIVAIGSLYMLCDIKKAYNAQKD